ncbi:MAG: phage portal protein [Gammaproteobacteria bacterium]|nr:phage portal protein [Gammaproteobacteria bacterium]
MWPFRAPVETREAPYTDLILQAQLADAEGKTIGASATAALEIAAGLVGRSLAAARVTPEPIAEAVSADFLDLAGRTLVRRGESVWRIDIRDGRLHLDPCGDWDVRGGWQPERWTYRTSVYGPTGTSTKTTRADSVVHLVWAVDERRPWAGLSPLAKASASGSLAGWLERRLSEEASGTVGHLLPMPEAPERGAFDGLKEAIAKLAGKVAFVESTRAKGRYEQGNAPRYDWRPERIGASPPQTLPVLRADVGRDILSACGIPPSLADQRTDGTAQRESFRRFLHVTLAPVARRIEAELGRKLDSPVELDLSDVNAADIAGRARAFQSLVKSGLTVADAAAQAGLMVDDDEYGGAPNTPPAGDP